MKPADDVYAKIPTPPTLGLFFQHVFGVYCQQCGRAYALYSYSEYPPDDLDENGKPFYKFCGLNGCLRPKLQ